MPPREDGFARELAWLRRFTLATAAASKALSSLRGEVLLVVCHLDVKMIPHFEALLAAVVVVLAASGLYLAWDDLAPVRVAVQVADHEGMAVCDHQVQLLARRQGDK